MRVLLDATPYRRDRPTGVGRYLACLIQGLAALENGPELFVLGTDEDLLDGIPNRDRIAFHRFSPKPSTGPLAREVKRQKALVRIARARRIDLVHTVLEPLLPHRGIVQVLTVHDVARGRRDIPGLADRSVRELMRTGLRYAAAKRADRIITVSEFTRKEVLHRLGIDPRKVRTVYTGLDETIARMAGATTDPPKDAPGESGYLLFVGETGRQKNEKRLLLAYSRLRMEGFNVGLVLVGGEGTGRLDLDNNVPDRDARQSIVVHATVTDSELVALYKQARAFILPSMYEGFGLPLLEAMACGAPAVVSRGTSLEEIAGGAAMLIDPTDAGSIFWAAAKLLGDHDLSETLRRKGLERASFFTLENMAQQTLDVYREAIGS